MLSRAPFGFLELGPVQTEVVFGDSTLLHFHLTLHLKFSDILWPLWIFLWKLLIQKISARAGSCVVSTLSLQEACLLISVVASLTLVPTKAAEGPLPLPSYQDLLCLEFLVVATVAWVWQDLCSSDLCCLLAEDAEVPPPHTFIGHLCFWQVSAQC